MVLFSQPQLSVRGPLRIKVTKSARRQQEGGIYSPARVFTRPWHIFRWMRDPDRWISSVAGQFEVGRRANSKASKPFTPEPLLFPSTWPPFRMLRNVAVAKAMATTSDLVPNSMHVVMRQFLIQQALMDEWHRVLMEEKRVGLGVYSIAVGFIATSFLFVTVALIDSVSAVLMLPSLLAVFASSWMNLYLYYERRRDRGKRQLVVVPVITNTGRRKRQLYAPFYEIKW